jgi:hypothetical protein
VRDGSGEATGGAQGAVGGGATRLQVERLLAAHRERRLSHCGLGSP